MPLIGMATQTIEKHPLRLCFHPFGDDVQAEAPRHRDDGRDNGRVSPVFRKIDDKRLVDLELIERMLQQIRDGIVCPIRRTPILVVQ